MASRGLIEPGPTVVADASAVINLVASGAIRQVAGSLGVPIRVVRVVAEELERGRQRWNTSDQLANLIAEGIVEIVDLDDAASALFEELVVGAAAETLDDGEAATIACALTNGLEALIDERKAWRICAQRYAALRVTTTVDLLIDPATEATLGTEGVADAIFHALRDARMRVPPACLERVVGIIGADRAELCSSLPLSARVAARKRAG